MTLTGQNILGFDLSAKGTNSFFAVNPRTNKELSTKYYQATKDEIDEAVKLAESAFSIYRNKSGAEKADFLDTIAKEILELDSNLITICQQETGLPEGRLIGERGKSIF